MDNVEDKDSKTQLHSILVFNYTPHLLTQIFTNLLLNDRKSVRLVCKDWYKACNAMNILAVEKLVCRDAIFGDREAFVRAIENSKRKILNLEFIWVTFTDSWPLAFWKKCGPKIRSLWFTDCLFSNQTLKHVILYGSQLQSLSLRLQSLSLRQVHCDDLYFRGYVSLDELVDLQVRRVNLSSIEVNVYEDDDDILCKWLENFFIIHPNVKNFTLFSELYSEEEILQSRKNHMFSIILQILTSRRTTFESIVIGELDECKFSQPIWETISHLTFPRLRKINVIVRTNVPNQLYLDFFTRHPQLNFVIITTYFTDNHNGDLVGLQIQQIVSGLLQACVHLQSLKLEQSIFQYGHSRIILPLDKCFFVKFLDSSLITFDYDSSLYDFKLVEPTHADTCTINYNLRSLNFPQDPERDMTLLLSRLFQGLTHLEVYEIDDDGLQSILKFQNNLRSLILNNCGKLTEFGFTGYHSDDKNNNDPHPVQGYSMKKLCKLQYLRLETLRCHGNLEKIFAEFNFPDLLHLLIGNIGANDEELPSAIGKLFTNLPKLEVFSNLNFVSYAGSMDFSLWLNMCSTLKNLHLLSLDNARFHEFEDECELMFKSCSKLRFLRVNGNDFVKMIHDDDFSKHVIVKKLSLGSQWYKYNPIYSTRFDTYTVGHCFW